MATPSTFSISSPIEVGNGVNVGLCTIRSGLNCSSTTSVIEAFIEAASTPISETSASPIISADAVAPVRRGSRIAFWPASLPVIPKTVPETVASTASTGRPRKALIQATDRMETPAPTPTHSAGLVGMSNPPGRLISGIPILGIAASTRPMASRTIPIDVRRTVDLAGGWLSSRIAATGGTLAARRDGSRAAASVTKTPTA